MISRKQIVIVTGMSGAGKTTVLKLLEDIGFYCADNIPASLLQQFVDICGGEERLAIGVDIRGGKMFEELLPAVGLIKPCPVILYMEADDKTLVRRYKESRRSHPLAKGGQLSDGISMERGLTRAVKDAADHTIDTSGLLTRELKALLNDIFQGGHDFAGIIVNVLSFGFKYGLPGDADMVFDVRFLPNPFYIEELRPLTGNDGAVADYVMSSPLAAEFLEKIKDMLSLLMPNFLAEGKSRLVLCIGCTGGRHRSVTLANETFLFLREAGYTGFVTHRDAGKVTAES